MKSFNELTPHEKMLKTVEDLKKRKEIRERKKQRDIDGAINTLFCSRSRNFNTVSNSTRIKSMH